ncbi:MAG: hypothetical protein CVV60_05395 [Tenericutes bacterium HGW-Tenericutes-5]|jgi:M6 family metalloprotease-like protein|nr:MAG: hypothetical protein CVV60_05395 [Tenericutes bacterium HGW-Tenericutes-5]
MKKFYFMLFSLTLVVFFVSCDFLGNKTTTNFETTSTDTVQDTTEASSISSSTVFTSSITDSSISTVNTTTNNPTTEASTTITTTTSVVTTTTIVITTETTTEEITTEINYPIIPSGYSLLQDELEYVGIPSIGEAKVLVFAVDFPDQPISNASSVLADLNIAFNGSSDDLVYESLHSYYLKSSYNKLDLTADIYGFYRAEHDSTYYETLNDEYYATDPNTGQYLYPDASHPDSDLIYELLTYYDGVIDYSQYDSNNDGYIDGVYVIYNHDVSYESGSDLWWAYQYYYMYYDTFDGVDPNYYVWMGLDFFYEGDEDINARTLIHESGHMLGLDDYYDYYPDDAYNEGGLGSFMMDYTIGDHEPFSKILLGWVTPIVIEKSMTVDLMPHLENGDVLLIIDEWNNTIFDEYLLVMYYTPEGLNELDTDYMFSYSGIVIFHISAAIDNGYNPDSYYYSIFNNNNTDSYNKLINIIEADMDEDIEKFAIVEDSDLFLAGDSLGYSVYPNYKWYNGNSINLIIDIVTIDDSHAVIEVFFK